MKSMIIVIITTIMFSLASCQQANINNDQSTSERLDPDLNKQINNSELDRQLGFVRSTKEEHNELQDIPQITTNRTEIANMITKIMLQTDAFIEVATLVTDQKVLIAYELSNKTESKQAETIAIKTAESVTPRHFDVHVSSNESLILDIQSLHNSTTNNNYYENIVDKIIDEMRTSR